MCADEKRVVSILTKDGYVWYSEHSSQVPNAYKSGCVTSVVLILILCLFLTNKCWGYIRALVWDSYCSSYMEINGWEPFMKAICFVASLWRLLQSADTVEDIEGGSHSTHPAWMQKLVMPLSYSYLAPSIISLSQISVGWLLETGRDPVGNRGGGCWGFLTAILK